MADDRIQTEHPDPGKQGVKIQREKYNAIQAAILDALRMHGDMTFQELNKAVEARIGAHFEGSVAWYFTTVKLDLEAKGLIEQVGRASPQRIRLKSGKK
jgi:hypothetical protein